MACLVLSHDPVFVNLQVSDATALGMNVKTPISLQRQKSKHFLLLSPFRYRLFMFFTSCVLLVQPSSDYQMPPSWQSVCSFHSELTQSQQCLQNLSGRMKELLYRFRIPVPNYTQLGWTSYLCWKVLSIVIFIMLPATFVHPIGQHTRSSPNINWLI